MGRLRVNCQCNKPVYIIIKKKEKKKKKGYCLRPSEPQSSTLLHSYDEFVFTEEPARVEEVH